MIGKALLTGPPQGMVVTCIYGHMCLHFPQLIDYPKSWENTVRHKLSFSDKYPFFVKGDRANDNLHLWQLHPAVVELFGKGKFSKEEACKLIERYKEDLHFKRYCDAYYRAHFDSRAQGQ